MSSRVPTLLAAAVICLSCREGGGGAAAGNDAGPAVDSSPDTAAALDAGLDAGPADASVDAAEVGVEAGAAEAGAREGLVWRRADGSQIAFSPASKLFVWCGPWEDDLIPVPALHVLFVGPTEQDPSWRLQVVTGDVIIGRPLTFPNNFVFGKPRGASLFLLDGRNELSTAEEQALGSLTFQALDCKEGGTVELSVDATLGSEFADLPTVKVTGSFAGVVGRPPS